MTSEEIRSRLGLLPREEFLKHRQHRQLGRTTEMLIEALIDVSSGKNVRFVGHTFDYANQLAMQARIMCERLGLDRERVVGGASYRLLERGLSSPGEILHYDHHCRLGDV